MVRRLAAILAADVAGYSRLMSPDAAGTPGGLKTHRSELIEPMVAKYGGRVVKLMGDGIVAEFSSVVAAVECAAEVQSEMAQRNRGKSDAQRMLLRIGIHLGDVITDGDDIYGGGGNTAARLEALAEVGGVCISGQVHDQVDGKLPLSFRALGAQTLKNIAKPVEVYGVDIGEAGAAVDQGKMELKVDYCRAPDGVRLAYATAGRGPPLVKTANWMNHVEFDWGGSLNR